MRRLLPVLLGVLLLANAASALELQKVHEPLRRALALRVERQGSRIAIERSRAALAQPLLWKAASMQCVDYGAGAAECRVVLADGLRIARSTSLASAP